MTHYTLTPHEQERVTTVHTNLKRANLTTKDLGKQYNRSQAQVLDVLKGRYTSDVTDTWLTQYEHYLNKLLGVRYVQPYFNDIEDDQ